MHHSNLKVGDVVVYTGKIWKSMWDKVGPIAVTGFLASGYPIGVAIRDWREIAVPEAVCEIDPFLTAVRKRRNP